MYCFEGALVLLVPQLTQYGAGSEGIARVAQYCISNHSTNIINEILLSIEHVDLIRVYSDGAVDHTDTMPLFDIRMPPFLAKRAYYPSTFLETTRARRGSRWQRGDRLRTNMLGAQGRVYSIRIILQAYPILIMKKMTTMKALEMMERTKMMILREGTWLSRRRIASGGPAIDEIVSESWPKSAAQGIRVLALILLMGCMPVRRRMAR